MQGTLADHEQNQTLPTRDDYRPVAGFDASVGITHDSIPVEFSYGPTKLYTDVSVPLYQDVTATSLRRLSCFKL